jgi:hypothetical protein
VGAWVEKLHSDFIRMESIKLGYLQIDHMFLLDDFFINIQTQISHTFMVFHVSKLRALAIP